MSRNAARTRLIASVLCCAFLLIPQGFSGLSVTPASAQGFGPSITPQPRKTDYHPDNQAWSGLSEFVALAATQRVEVELTETLDWSAIGAQDIVIALHPLDPLQVENAGNYILDGGMMLYAIEGGSSYPFLDRLGIRYLDVQNGELPHDRFVEENPNLPIFSPTGAHALIDDVQSLVANHPTVLLNVGGPVVAYAEGGGLVYDMNFGDGKVVALADASMLINQMLQVADNAKFARNTLQYLCADRKPCRAILLVENFEQRGTYINTGDKHADKNTWSRWIREFNETLSQMMQDVPVSRLLYYLGILLAGGLALYLAAVFRLRAGRPYSAHIEKGGQNELPPQSEFDWNLARFGRGGRETNYALALAILKEQFEELFLDALDKWPIPADERPTVAVLASEYRRRFLRDAPDAKKLERQARDLLATYASIPTRHRVFLDSDAYFSERDLIKIYRSTREILRRMGLEEEYERRTRDLV
ncbi:DUF4350 domain-containing protein [Bradymonas sediminis]|uniref:Uncharacterized protein n=1 Tax=Bradymonas sediminis TaxID=1548548 RepID=A0A2Z4FMF5_9DELT|nr:DUF4350 domain-containing protein [Bradymonas sediminis]AWV90005.1 hypothetical protein DN745_11910 [Bradymonas sediminis]TDP76040.1 hypothetical protein DFR33_103391 [Bradymonas sediminis]